MTHSAGHHEHSDYVYDKAKWHYEGDFPEGLDSDQAYVHTGMFVGWLLDNDLMSEEFKGDLQHEIAQFKQRELTGTQLYQRCCDGSLLPEDINELGNRFTLAYFDFEQGQYLADYEIALGQGLPSIYHVADTWENYGKLKLVLDGRFADWKRANL